MMKKTKKKIISSVVFFILAFFLAFYIIFSAFASNKATVKYFYMKGFLVGSSSMEPYIMTNDVIFTRKVKEENISEGDIITFETYVEENNFFGKIVVTHYVGKIEEVDGVKTFKTQAYKDFNTDNYDENWLNENKEKTDITYDDIIGKYAFKIPKIGFIILFIQNIFKSPIMLVLVVLNIAIIYALYKMIKPKKIITEDESSTKKDSIEKTD